MYAVAFDLVVAETEKNHPKDVNLVYSDISALAEHGFRRVQGSLYITDNEGMATPSSIICHAELALMPSLLTWIKGNLGLLWE